MFQNLGQRSQRLDEVYNLDRVQEKNLVLALTGGLANPVGQPAIEKRFVGWAPFS